MNPDDDAADVIEGQRFPRSEAVGCYLCGQHHPARRIPVAFGMHAMVAECPACRMAFQSPRPSPEASLAYMNWRWRSDDAYVGNRASQMRRAMTQVGHVRRFVDGPVRLLDFGAGAGSFVRAALDQGWDASGVEQSSSARQRAKALYDVELLDRLGTERYDVVTLWDVVEHLRDPRGLLAMLGEHLTANGLIFIETGNFENWRRIAEKDDWGLYLFDHQFYFSPSSLRQVLRDAGYQGYCLLDCNRARPSLDPGHALRNPSTAARSWLAWAQAKARWPAHGDINVMVVAARKAPGLVA